MPDNRTTDDETLGPYVLGNDELGEALALLGVVVSAFESPGGAVELSTPNGKKARVPSSLLKPIANLLGVLTTRRSAVVHVLDPVEKIGLQKAAQLLRIGYHPAQRLLRDGNLPYRMAGTRYHSIAISDVLKLVGRVTVSGELKPDLEADAPCAAPRTP